MGFCTKPRTLFIRSYFHEFEGGGFYGSISFQHGNRWERYLDRYYEGVVPVQYRHLYLYKSAGGNNRVGTDLYDYPRQKSQPLDRYRGRRHHHLESLIRKNRIP